MINQFDFSESDDKVKGDKPKPNEKPKHSARRTVFLMLSLFLLSTFTGMAIGFTCDWLTAGPITTHPILPGGFIVGTGTGMGVGLVTAVIVVIKKWKAK